MDVPAVLGARVKALTQATPGLRREAVAAQTGISLAHLRNIELGLKAPSVVIAVALARFFQVSTDYLLGLTDDPTPRPVPQDSDPGSRPGQAPAPDLAETPSVPVMPTTPRPPRARRRLTPA